jgi:two-component system OmpR family sensor kinase
VSLRLRLALFGAAVVALTLVLFGLLLYGLFARSVGSNQDDALRTRAQQAVSSISTRGVAARPPVAPADLSSSTEIFVEVLDPAGSTLYTTGLLNGEAPAVPPPVLSDAGAHHGAFTTIGGAKKGAQLRLYVLPISGGYVVAGQSTQVPVSNLSGVVVFLVISAIPTLIAALVASWLVAGRALRPLRLVASTADEIGRTRDFGRRLTVGRSRDEVAVLSANFNRMLEALQDANRGLAAALEAQRRFVADASHELRTPLSTIQGNAGLLALGPDVSDSVRRAAAADIAAESDRMARLTDRLLTLARADSGLDLQLATVELRPLLAEVVRQASTLHPEKSIALEADELSVGGDPDALRQLIWILLDNATRHARTAVAVRLHGDAGWARLVVSDDGAGVPADERERIFERFYKVDAVRSSAAGQRGAGLGLAIARWITGQHQGRIIAGESPLGGAAFFVDLPASPDR